MMGLMHRSSGSAIWIIVAGCVILPIVPLLAFIMAALGIAIGLYTVDEDSSLSIPALVSGIILGILSFMLAYMNFTLFSYW